MMSGINDQLILYIKKKIKKIKKNLNFMQPEISRV